VQEPQLYDDEEQEEDPGSPGVQEVLSPVPEPYSAQGDEVIADFGLGIAD
jgi:hypothetical protein